MNKFMYVYLAIPLIYSLLLEVEFLRPTIHTLIIIMNMYIQVAIHKDHLNFSREYVFQMFYGIGYYYYLSLKIQQVL